MKVKFFTGTKIANIEKNINEWLARTQITPEMIVNSLQNMNQEFVIISIFYNEKDEESRE